VEPDVHPVTSPVTRSGFGSASHLARRFAGSLWPGGPSPSDEAWARSFLNDGEQALWIRMTGPDRRHAVAVARRLAVAAGDMAATSELAATCGLAATPAALLHDVGKVESRLGTFGRAVVTLAAITLGRDRLARNHGRMGRYLRHDAIGADLLERVGSDQLTITWAREHHLPPERWTVPPGLGSALKAADDD
jgi:hypothetical protein